MKRQYRFGRLFKRGKTWHIDYYINGKRYKESTDETVKWKAEEYLNNKKQELTNSPTEEKIIYDCTFEEAASEWLSNYSKVYHSQSHYEGNINRLNAHILPYFGNKNLSNIIHKDILRFLSVMKSKEVMVRKKSKRTNQYIKVSTGKPLSAKQINLTLDTLRLILAYAESNNYIESNPADGIKKLKGQKPAFRYLNEDQTRELLENCNSDFYPICSTAVYTGMRLYEIIGLKWQNVLYDSRRIVVESSGTGPTKSRKVRYIPLNKNLEEILSQLDSRKSEYVFPDEEGNMRGSNRKRVDFRHSLESALKKAELPRIKFHDLRHTFASNFVMKGGSLLSLKEILGHSDINTTMMYAHLAPSYLEEEINRLDFS